MPPSHVPRIKEAEEEEDGVDSPVLQGTAEHQSVKESSSDEFVPGKDFGYTNAQKAAQKPSKFEAGDQVRVLGACKVGELGRVIQVGERLLVDLDSGDRLSFLPSSLERIEEDSDTETWIASVFA